MTIKFLEQTMARKKISKRKAPSRRPKRRVNITPPDCRHFTGYKPCFPLTNCLEECQDPRPQGTRILIINLEAMGNVLVATTLLPPLKRKYPESTISWLTLGNALPLLAHNPYVDHLYRWEPESWMKLRAMKFDVVINLDKSRHTGALIKTLTAGKKLGYGIDENGVIVPLNREAHHHYLLGLDDHEKFRVNQKSSSQLLTESVGLEFRRDEYVLVMTTEERNFCRQYAADMNITASLVIGLNTGCSLLYPNKKMTIDQHLVLINALARIPDVQVLLLGGPEDTERNAEIARQAGVKIISTPTTEGVRRGICYENICHLVISGDSFGMHVAVALKKYVIAWFGVSCPQEIDLFDRGIKLIPEGLLCSPCWKKECPYNLECIQMIDLDRMVEAVEEFRVRKKP
jgi:ADP-heptose:LPS heptosyltransferase